MTRKKDPLGKDLFRWPKPKGKLGSWLWHLTFVFVFFVWLSFWYDDMPVWLLWPGLVSGGLLVITLWVQVVVNYFFK